MKNIPVVLLIALAPFLIVLAKCPTKWAPRLCPMACIWSGLCPIPFTNNNIIKKSFKILKLIGVILDPILAVYENNYLINPNQ